MQYKADNPDQYVDQLPDDRKEAIGKLRNSIPGNLPEGFIETVNYGMISYVVPHTLYPNGYHCDPEKPSDDINLSFQLYISINN